MKGFFDEHVHKRKIHIAFFLQSSEEWGKAFKGVQENVALMFASEHTKLASI